jgi:flagellar assembly protein FliH
LRPRPGRPADPALERPRTHKQLIQAMDERVADAERAGYARGKAEGLAAGREEGLRAGREEGAARVRGEVSVALETYAAVARSLEESRQELIETARRSAIELAFRVAEKVIARHLDETETMAARLDQALGAIGEAHGEPIVVRVASVQLAEITALGRQSPDLQADLRIVSDPSLEPGDLVVESAGRRIESIVREQLALLEEALADV